MNIPFQKITVIDLGLVQIHVWGLLVALGMLGGLLVTLREAKRVGIEDTNIYDIFILMFISSMIGARLLYVVLFWQNFSGHWLDIFKVWDGGMVFYGGFLAAILVIWRYLKKEKIKFLKAADMMAPGMALGLGIGRIGCYLIGDHLGAKTDFFLGSMFQGELRHEPSLYLSINGFILFLVLWSLRGKLKKYQGAMAYLFFVWYGVTRFLLDFTRASDIAGLSDPRFSGLTISQWISIAFVIMFVPLFISKVRK